MAEAAGLRWLGRINTSQVKAAMGHGRANKEAMISLARMRFGVDVSDHVADAIGVALAALRKNEHQQLVRAYSARNNSRRA
jgi:fructosamine-3-kinase